MADFFARESKQGGAWMSSFDEVTTLFHEFGHALHGLLSKVKYPLLSGTNVPRDFVEYPSQYNEMWGAEPAVVAHYARHHQTGESIPQALLQKVLRARSFNQGFATSEYLAAALLDQNLHQLHQGETPSAEALTAFEVESLKQHGIDVARVAPRYHTLYFSHVFAGGYAAGYYAYVWAEVLAADTEHWMRAHGGLQRTNGARLRDKVLSRGNAEKPLAQFESFYGGKPEIAPLLQRRGLVIA